MEYKKAKKEPGISSVYKMTDLPNIKGTLPFEYSLQHHFADRAGPHFDLRLGDPSTGIAHSWAVPKERLPAAGERPLLAIMQPDHTMKYMDFSGILERGRGKGKVDLLDRMLVDVLSSEPSKIKFRIPEGERKGDYSLFRTGERRYGKKTKIPLENWLIRNLEKDMAAQEKISEFYKLGFFSRVQKGKENFPSHMRDLGIIGTAGMSLPLISGVMNQSTMPQIAEELRGMSRSELNRLAQPGDIFLTRPSSPDAIFDERTRRTKPTITDLPTEESIRESIAKRTGIDPSFISSEDVAKQIKEETEAFNRLAATAESPHVRSAEGVKKLLKGETRLERMKNRLAEMYEKAKGESFDIFADQKSHHAGIVSDVKNTPFGRVSEVLEHTGSGLPETKALNEVLDDILLLRPKDPALAQKMVSRIDTFAPKPYSTTAAGFGGLADIALPAPIQELIGKTTGRVCDPSGKFCSTLVSGLADESFGAASKNLTMPQHLLRSNAFEPVGATFSKMSPEAKGLSGKFRQFSKSKKFLPALGVGMGLTGLGFGAKKLYDKFVG